MDEIDNALIRHKEQRKIRASDTIEWVEEHVSHPDAEMWELHKDEQKEYVHYLNEPTHASHLDSLAFNGVSFEDMTEATKASEPTGWSSSYYELPKGAKELGDLIDYKEMNFNIGNIFKAAYRLGNKRGTSELYDLNKIKWFVEREINRVMSSKESNDE